MKRVSKRLPHALKTVPQICSYLEFGAVDLTNNAGWWANARRAGSASVISVLVFALTYETAEIRCRRCRQRRARSGDREHVRTILTAFLFIWRLMLFWYRQFTFSV